MLPRRFINRFITALIIGVNSGLAYALLGSTFTAYLDDHHLSLAVIGLLSLRSLPYSFKYLWSPIVDSVHLKFFPVNFGQRKEWLISMQVLLIVCFMVIGLIDVHENLPTIFVIAFLTALIAATYDIALEAYRIELFVGKEADIGNTLVVWGFRAGLLISGVIALYLTVIFEWQWIFMLMALPILPCMLVIWFSKDERQLNSEFTVEKFSAWVRVNFLEAFITLWRLPKLPSILLLVTCYKLSDGFLDAMLMPFLMEIGFSKPEIATLAKTGGLVGIILGTLSGVYFIRVANFTKVLLIAELMAAVTNLLFIILANIGYNYFFLGWITLAENFCSGICNIVLIHYMSSLCVDKRFNATHYAILISISGSSRALLSSVSGLAASTFGWTNFFILSSLLSIPSLLCIYFIYIYKKPAAT